jgi:hypothetical protein
MAIAIAMSLGGAIVVGVVAICIYKRINMPKS